MNKSELVNQVAQDANISKKEATEAVNSILNSIEKSLVKGDAVKLQGFGTFKVTERSARTGRNPKTGETLEIAAKKVPQFKAAELLKSKFPAE